MTLERYLLSAVSIVLMLACGAVVVAVLLLTAALVIIKPSTPIHSIPTIIFLGSGGHTTEMISLIEELSPVKYFPLHFVMSHSDVTSEKKFEATSKHSKNNIIWHKIHRSREVKQSWITTIYTTLISLVDSFFLVLKTQPRLVICNGPGTCVPICYSVYMLKIVSIILSKMKPMPMKDSKIIFVESFCRVENLSLTGKLLYPIADKFLVQWPSLAKQYRRAEYVGVIC